MSDLKPELRRCIEAADPIVPDLQYSLRVTLRGGPSGTVAEEVELLRLSGRKQFPTAAAACVTDLIMHLELPPCTGWSQMLTVVR